MAKSQAWVSTPVIGEVIVLLMIPVLNACGTSPALITVGTAPISSAMREVAGL
ncbi:hypothetical protein D9M68_960630 [compost metagenome]